MSVEIRFEPDGPSGQVAEGTLITDAARRLGFQITDCGECDGTCVIRIVTGIALLSDLTDTERKQLSPERLASGDRLACQCKAERGGELVTSVDALLLRTDHLRLQAGREVGSPEEHRTCQLSESVKL